MFGSYHQMYNGLSNGSETCYNDNNARRGLRKPAKDERKTLTATASPQTQASSPTAGYEYASTKFYHNKKWSDKTPCAPLSAKPRRLPSSEQPKSVYKKYKSYVNKSPVANSEPSQKDSRPVRADTASDLTALRPGCTNEIWPPSFKVQARIRPTALDGVHAKPFTTPMYRSLKRASSMVVKEAPDELLNGSSWDQLSHAVWEQFLVNQQCEEVYRAKILLWEWLYLVIKTHFPRYGLYLVGSTTNGFGTETSDIDLCMMIHKVEVDQRTEAPLHLKSVSDLLSYSSVFDEVQIIHAKVPLLKFRDNRTGLFVDLNCNNSVGMRNTNLLYCYSQLNWRVKPLVIVVKMWAQSHHINDAKSMTLSSYSLTLMVIHFLQYGVSPAVLPCLQKGYKNRFGPDMKICALSTHERVKPYCSENQQSLGELFLRFLQYYATFDYSHNAISVRMGSTISTGVCRFAKSPKNDPLQWRYICIEEPFDLTNTARSVHDPQKFQLILDVIRSSADLLNRTGELGSVMYRSPPPDGGN